MEEVESDLLNAMAGALNVNMEVDEVGVDGVVG